MFLCKHAHTTFIVLMSFMLNSASELMGGGLTVGQVNISYYATSARYGEKISGSAVLTLYHGTPQPVFLSPCLSSSITSAAVVAALCSIKADYRYRRIVWRMSISHLTSLSDTGYRVPCIHPATADAEVQCY
jgi:hypothetical protein